jgi:transposase
MKKRQFTQEYKLEAVRLFHEGKQPAVDIARALNIPRSRLYGWVQSHAQSGEAALAPAKMGRKPDDELARLRRQNAQLQEEIAILKKAAAYFAKELK